MFILNYSLLFYSFTPLLFYSLLFHSYLPKKRNPFTIVTKSVFTL